MKITSNQLQQIIREEIEGMSADVPSVGTPSDDLYAALGDYVESQGALSGYPEVSKLKVSVLKIVEKWFDDRF